MVKFNIFIYIYLYNQIFLIFYGLKRKGWRRRSNKFYFTGLSTILIFRDHFTTSNFVELLCDGSDYEPFLKTFRALGLMHIIRVKFIFRSGNSMWQHTHQLQKLPKTILHFVLLMLATIYNFTHFFSILKKNFCDFHKNFMLKF